MPKPATPVCPLDSAKPRAPGPTRCGQGHVSEIPTERGHLGHLNPRVARSSRIRQHELLRGSASFTIENGSPQLPGCIGLSAMTYEAEQC